MVGRRREWVVPVVAGTGLALVVGWALHGAGAEIAEPAVAFLLGAAFGSRPFRLGLLLVLPLLPAVAIIGGRASFAVMLLCVLALAGVGVFNGLIASLGVLVRRIIVPAE